MVVIEWLGISDGAACFLGAVALVVVGVLVYWNLPSDWDDVDGAAA